MLCVHGENQRADGKDVAASLGCVVAGRKAKLWVNEGVNAYCCVFGREGMPVLIMFLCA